MKIVIDARVIGWTGIGRYTEMLLDNLQHLDETNTYMVLLQQKDYDGWQPISPKFQKVMADFAPYSLSEQIRLPSLLRQLKPDLVHFPHFTVPVLYNKPYVVTIHDLTLIDYKNIRDGFAGRIFYNIKQLIMRLVIFHAIKSARQVVTDTKFVKQEISRRYRLKAAKVTAIMLAADKTLITTSKGVKANDSAPYVLYVGNYYPYKNIGRLVEAFGMSKFRASGGQLVLVGKDDYFQNVIRKQVINLNLEESVIFPGYVSDTELAELYGKATMYVFPSLSEGFGLPGLEAMIYDLPVLSSNVSCLPEVYGDAAVYFNPYDIGDITRKIDNLLDDPKQQDELRRAGRERIKQFSWEKMTQETLAVYQSAFRK